MPLQCFFCNSGAENAVSCATIVMVHVLIKLSCAIPQVVVPGFSPWMPKLWYVGGKVVIGQVYLNTQFHPVNYQSTDAVYALMSGSKLIGPFGAVGARD